MAEITPETLKLAALAAGMIPAEFIGNVNYFDDMPAHWRPHTDPGDAMKLAVQLDMEINMSHGQVAATVNGWLEWARVKHDGTQPDKLRAWCEAVVLCAAAVGKIFKKGRA